MLSMLRITGDAPWAMLLNGQMAGAAEQGELELPVGRGQMLVQIFPLEKDLLPVTALLEPSPQPRLTAPKDAAKLLVLSEKYLHLRVCFPRIPRENPAMPYILRRQSTDAGLQATVYFDRTFNFAIERSGRILLSGTFRRGDLAESRITKVRDGMILEGLGSGGSEFFAVSLRGEPAVIHHAVVKELTVGEDHVEYTRISGPLLLRERFSLTERKVASAEIAFSEKDRKDVFLGLLEAIRLKQADFAMSLIAPALKKDADFGAFCGFVGEYAEFYEPWQGTGEIALCYPQTENVFTVRRLRAAVKNEQILNIEEV